MMSVLGTSAEAMAHNFLAGLSFLPNMNKTDENQKGSDSPDRLAQAKLCKKDKMKIGDGTVSRGSAGKGRGKKPEVPTERTAPQWCDVCRITLNAPNQLEQHFAGKSHSKRLKMTHREAEELVKAAADSQIDETKPTPLNPSGLVKRVIEANAPRGENGKLRCVLCGVTMPSPQVAQTHFNGKKHQKKLAALKAASQTQEEILNDPVCDITSPGAIGTDVSLTRAIKRDNRPNVVSSPSSSSAFPSSSPPAGCSNLAPSYQPTVAAFRCDVCSITVTSITQLTQHQAGLKHLKKVQKESRLDAG